MMISFSQPVCRVPSSLIPVFYVVDPWAPNIDSQSIASQLFAFSLFPYIGFLYYITKSKSAPKLTLFGFYFLLAFVGATIPAGIYAKVHYGTSLSNVDWLHGGAEKINLLSSPCFLCSASGQPQVPVHQDFIPAECLRYWIIVKTVTRNHKYSA
ncbi:hypothetical protein OIU78_013678 [Salix suchowensis]|nr:hypothetical protein OIU78_013678 [Salix suchowensis]